MHLTLDSVGVPPEVMDHGDGYDAANRRVPNIKLALPPGREHRATDFGGDALHARDATISRISRVVSKQAMGFGEYRWRDSRIPEKVWDALEVASDLLVDFVRSDVECGERSEYLVDLLPGRYTSRYDFIFLSGFLNVLETVRDQLWDEKPTDRFLTWPSSWR